MITDSYLYIDDSNLPTMNCAILIYKSDDMLYYNLVTQKRKKKRKCQRKPSSSSSFWLIYYWIIFIKGKLLHINDMNPLPTNYAILIYKLEVIPNYKTNT